MVREQLCWHLLSVELVELCLAVVFAPQTEHFRLGTVRHVDQLLKPPPFTDCTRYTPQDQAVITHLYTHTHMHTCHTPQDQAVITHLHTHTHMCTPVTLRRIRQSSHTCTHTHTHTHTCTPVKQNEAAAVHLM